MEKLKSPERHADLGLAPNQRISYYFRNPLSEDAEIAAQLLHRKKNTPKVKKPKGKKSKKRARLRKSESIPSSDVEQTLVPQNQVRSRSYDRANDRESKPNDEVPIGPDHALSSLVNAANQLIEIATSSIKHNPEETYNIKGKASGKVNGKANGKFEKKKGRADGTNEILWGHPRSQSLLPRQDLEI